MIYSPPMKGNFMTKKQTKTNDIVRTRFLEVYTNENAPHFSNEEWDEIRALVQKYNKFSGDSSHESGEFTYAGYKIKFEVKEIDTLQKKKCLILNIEAIPIKKK